jgi:hypothetical protein
MMQRNSFIRLNRRALSIFIISLTLLRLLAACGPAEEDGGVTPLDGNGYPVGAVPGYPTLSTLSENPAYPSESQVDESERFKIDQPLVAGSTTVTGQAPKNLSLAIVNMTLGGTILGTGLSDDDGRFTITVSPLPEGYRIGVTVTDVEPGTTFEDVAVELYEYRGKGYMSVPSIGVFFDSAMVGP